MTDAQKEEFVAKLKKKVAAEAESKNDESDEGGDAMDAVKQIEDALEVIRKALK